MRSIRQGDADERRGPSWVVAVIKERPLRVVGAAGQKLSRDPAQDYEQDI